jgi:hypothetical protein
MIRCEMAGCVYMADVVASYDNEIYGPMELDYCQSCADYLAEDLSLEVKLTPYANKELKLNN